MQIKRQPRAFEVLIVDEGPGFEPDRYFTVEESRLFDSHGRGIRFAKLLLELEYLDSGNQVRLTVPRSVEADGCSEDVRQGQSRAP